MSDAALGATVLSWQVGQPRNRGERLCVYHDAVRQRRGRGATVGGVPEGGGVAVNGRRRRVACGRRFLAIGFCRPLRIAERGKGLHRGRPKRWSGEQRGGQGSRAVCGLAAAWGAVAERSRHTAHAAADQRVIWLSGVCLPIFKGGGCKLYL